MVINVEPANFKKNIYIEHEEVIYDQAINDQILMITINRFKNYWYKINNNRYTTKLTFKLYEHGKVKKGLVLNNLDNLNVTGNRQIIYCRKAIYLFHLSNKPSTKKTSLTKIQYNIPITSYVKRRYRDR